MWVVGVKSNREILNNACRTHTEVRSLHYGALYQLYDLYASTCKITSLYVHQLTNFDTLVNRQTHR